MECVMETERKSASAIRVTEWAGNWAGLNGGQKIGCRENFPF
jgi:hypothetical protein